MWSGLSEAGNSTVSVLFPELTAPLTEAEHELRGSLVSKPLSQGNGQQTSCTGAEAGFILVLFDAAPAFEHGGLEQHTKNQPIPAAFAFRPLQQKIIKSGDINRGRL